MHPFPILRITYKTIFMVRERNNNYRLRKSDKVNIFQIVNSYKKKFLKKWMFDVQSFVFT